MPKFPYIGYKSFPGFGERKNFCFPGNLGQKSASITVEAKKKGRITMKRRTFAIWLAVLTLLAAGCGGGGASKDTAAAVAPAASTPASEDMGGEYWETVDSPDFNGAELAPSAPEQSEAESGSSVYQNPGAKLIRRAELNIQTEQFDQSEQALKQLVAGCGGYFETSSVYGGGLRDANADRRGEYTVRVPAERYSEFLNSTGDLGYVTSKTESSEDVGERYYDTEARLKTQRTKQERLLALLEKAETMEDIITLESALSEVEYQIEQYSSELNRYDALVSFATFTIYLKEVGRITQEVGETASLGTRMAAGFRSSFRGLVQGGQDFLIWASYNIFLLVILAAVAVAAVIIGKRELKKLNKKGENRGQDK